MAKKQNNQFNKKEQGKNTRKRTRAPRYKADPEYSGAKAGKFHDESEIKHDYNDASWYAKNDQMLKDAASFSYNSPIGDRIGVNFITSALDQIQEYTANYVPGVCAFHIAPTIGKSIDSTSPANMAAQNIYSFVRYMNSGAKNYDQADLMLYLLAMDSVYSAWNWIKRIYGYISIYSQYSRYMPDALAVADNVDYNDIKQHLSDLRYSLNQWAAQITSFCVPATMTYFVRHSWMYSNVYKDSDTLKAQMYLFTPTYFWKYDETGSEYGGQLVPVTINSHATTSAPDPWTYEGLVELMRSLIDAVSYSEDIGVMSGDILKAYGDSKLFKLSKVEPDYTVIPIYNEEVLNQMHNSTIIDFAVQADNGQQTYPSATVTQDPNSGYLIFNPVTSASYVALTNHVINMPWNDVTPANTMVATRLTAGFVWNQSTPTGYALYGSGIYGTECVTERNIVYVAENGQTGVRSFQRFFDSDNVVPIDTYNVALVEINHLCLITQFDWHPLLHMFKVESSGSGRPTRVDYRGIIGDMNNYTVISNEDLERLHKTAIMSEFDIPQLGAF